MLPIITVATTKVRQENVTQYLAAVHQAMITIEQTEPGMLFHDFVNDPKNDASFFWTSYLENEALLAHFVNPAMGPYLTAHGLLGVGSFHINMYGTPSMDVRAFIAAAGIPTTYHETVLGFSRIDEFCGGYIQTNTESPPPAASPHFGLTLPIITAAKVLVKPGIGNVTEYLHAAALAMGVIEDTEPGMLHHTFDMDPSDVDYTSGSTFWWVSFLENNAFLEHFSNPAIGPYISAHGEYGIGPFDLMVIGVPTTEVRAAITAAGIPVTYYDSFIGYSRIPDHNCTMMSDPTNRLLPIISIGRLLVKRDNVSQYLAEANIAMNVIEQTEPGMLWHTFDRDPTNETKFQWSSFLENEALLEHMLNPALGPYITAHGELGVGGFDLHVYGTPSAALRGFLASAGMTPTYYESVVGFSRIAEHCGPFPVPSLAEEDDADDRDPV
eukprot:956007-Prymnesium_polylepis.1